MTEDDSRPNPDELLARVKAEEERKRHGKLKIFLGYAAGVGKTYAMLEAAQQRKSEIDLIVAYVETHGRVETEALLNGLEIVPPKQVDYHAITLSEMDMDAVLARHPQLVLVDELAHTNAPGSRHPKRYQDVEELLEAGIDVYTTLNIQHVESLRNAVAQVTSVWVRETIPDTVIDKAVEIELVDLPPDELLKRLSEGKVYIPEQIARATKNFFRKGNLTALRELTLRVAATHVDHEMQDYKQNQAIKGVWPTAEHLLVCVSPHRIGNHVVRTARSFASQLNAKWTVVFVETPSIIHLSSAEQNRLHNTMQLAERLGAKVLTIRGVSVVNTLTAYASKNNITKIIVGRSQRISWHSLLRRSVVNQLIRQSSHFDIYVVNDREESIKEDRTVSIQSPHRWWHYVTGVVLVILATGLGHLVLPFFAPVNLVMLYLLSVVVSAIYFGLGPSVMVSILGVLAFDFFLVPPYLTFAVTDAEYILTFFALLSVGIVVSYLTSGIRQQAETARRSANEIATLFALSKRLAFTVGMEAAVYTIITSARETFGCDVAILMPEGHDQKNLRPYSDNHGLVIDENERAVAIWALQHQKNAGRGTDTLPNARAQYVPLKTATGIIGVMGIWADNIENQFTIEQSQLLEAFTDLAGIAIERAHLADEAGNAQVLEASHKLQTTLLNSITHDLRTPLVSIIGVLSSLQSKGMHLSTADVKRLIQVAREEAERLNHLITNMLDVSKLEAGAVKITKQPSDLQDILGAALEQFNDRISERPVKIDIPDDLPFIPVDFALIVQVLVNILDNAFKYSSSNAPVEIEVRRIDQRIQIEVADRGVGIPQEELTRVFDKFYRVHRPENIAGSGLGLSICKGIVEAHGGTIRAENRQGGGTIILLTLPLTDAPEKRWR